MASVRLALCARRRLLALPAFHYHLGLALAGSGDRLRGRDAFETALKLQPTFTDARRELTALDQ